MARHNDIGKIGEDIAARWLETKGHAIIDRNYRRKWGEIDIVSCLPAGQAGETEKIHFVEVKAVSYETNADLDDSVSPASRAGRHQTWRPEEKVNKQKLERLARAVESWLTEHREQRNFQIDVITVKLVPREKIAKVSLIENIIIE